MDNENKFAVADAVQPEKPKRHKIIMPRWVLMAWCAVVLAVGGYSLPFLFDAFAWANVLNLLGMILIGVLWLTTIFVMILAFRVTSGTRKKVILGIFIFGFISAITFPPVIIILIWLSVVFIPITAMLLIMAFMVLFSSGISYEESLGVLGLSQFLGILLIGFQWYGMLQYEVVNSARINDFSYHYITVTGFMDPPIATLYQCNPLGFGCEELFYSGWVYGDDYTWQINRGTDTRITLFVNGAVIHEAVIE